MINVNNLLIGNTNNLQRKSVFWNMMSGILNAIQSSILMFFIVRINGTYDAGILSIAYATSYLMLTIGLFGMRNFQVTDVNNKYNFSDYYGSRIASILFMVSINLFYVISKPYSLDKTIIILSFCAFKMIDAIEDVYHGMYQQKNRLDIAGKAMSIRLALSLFVFLSTYLVTKNMVFATVLTTGFSFILFLIINRIILRNFDAIVFNIDLKKVKRLLINCAPLFLASFLSIYISNAPKYAIDSNLSEDLQAFFGILFTPVYLIKLLSSFIYRPKLTLLANQWNNNGKTKFIILIIKQIMIIATFTLTICLLAYFFGTEILTIVYGQNLMLYRKEFIILLIGGGMTAIVDFINTSLTIIRAQYILLYSYIVIAILSFFLSKPVVYNYSLLGASILYTAMFTLMGIVFACFLIYRFKVTNEGKDNK